MIIRQVNEAWAMTMSNIMARGDEVSPRGMLTKELPQHTICVDMSRPVLTVPERSLNYKFMAAEAFWILSGDDTTAGITPWNKHIGKFSDDGTVFAGAYGPMVVSQLNYVARKLVSDSDTRQAVMIIWRPNPQPSKDIPCTVAISFQIRRGKLNAHVFMRSSDVWLGVPYDIFNFSMLAVLTCGMINKARPFGTVLSPGALYLTAASSHLYESNWADARQCINHSLPPELTQPEIPTSYFTGTLGPAMLMAALEELRESAPGSKLRWWEDKK